MTAMLAPAPPTTPVQPVVQALEADVPSGEWGWRLVTVLLGPVADRNPDVALTVLRTADELADNGRAWVQRLTRRALDEGGIHDRRPRPS